MSKKSDEPIEEIINISFLPQLASFMEGSYFNKKIDSFLEKNLDFFLNYSTSSSSSSSSNDSKDYKGDFKTTDAEDHVTEYTHETKEIFDQYQTVLEDLFTTFAEENNITIQQIFQSCKDAAEGRFAPIFGEDENAWVVDWLLSLTDFDVFIKTMKKRAKEYNGTLGDSKNRK